MAWQGRRGRDGLGAGAHTLFGAGTSCEEIEYRFENDQEFGLELTLCFDLVIDFAQLLPGGGVEQQVALLQDGKDGPDAVNVGINTVGAFRGGSKGFGRDVGRQVEFGAGVFAGAGRQLASQTNAMRRFRSAEDLVGGHIPGVCRWGEGLGKCETDRTMNNDRHGYSPYCKVATEKGNPRLGMRGLYHRYRLRSISLPFFCGF